MEDVDRILSLLEISIPTIKQKIKEVDEYDERRMGSSRQKGTRKNMDVSSSVDRICHLKGNDNRRFNDDIGQII